MKPCNIMQMRSSGGGGPVVAFPITISVGGLDNCEIWIDNNGTYSRYQDGSYEGGGTWLLAGTAADVVGNLHQDSGNATAGMVKDVDVSFAADQSISLNAGAASKSAQLTLTVKRASDGAVLDYVNLDLYADGSGGTTMTL